MKTQKRFTPILIVVAVLIMVAIGSAYYFRLQKSTNFTPSATPAATLQITQPTSSRYETANWKTYTNTKGGYTFSHPSSWHFYSEDRLDKIPGHLLQRVYTDTGTLFENKSTQETFNVDTKNGRVTGEIKDNVLLCDLCTHLSEANFLNLKSSVWDTVRENDRSLGYSIEKLYQTDSNGKKIVVKIIHPTISDFRGNPDQTMVYYYLYLGLIRPDKQAIEISFRYDKSADKTTLDTFDKILSTFSVDLPLAK